MAQPTLHVSLTGRQSAQLWPAGHCSQRARAQGGGRYQLLGLAPLGGHSQPCRSSSSQTMRVIFSQCFNTSQLANTQGRRESSTQPAQMAGRPSPLPTLPPPLRYCLSRFSTAPSKSPPKLQSCPKETRKKNQSLIKGPKAKTRRSRHGKHSSPSKHPHFSPAP